MSSQPYYGSSDPESEDEEPQYPVSNSYSSSFPFAATSWQLRRNLSETFERHAKDEKKASRAKQPAESITTVSDRIAKFEQQSSLSKATAFPFAGEVSQQLGRPPRKPAPEPSSTKHLEKRCVSVFLRIRPPTGGKVDTIEILPGQPSTKVRTHAPQQSNAAKLKRDATSSITLDAPGIVAREFSFQQVFGPETTNDRVYSSIVAPMVNRMFPQLDSSTTANKEPESGLLFAYGATNAGKTYSILGNLPTGKGDAVKVNKKHWGIVPRAFEDILAKIEYQKVKEPAFTFDLSVSYYEIYNEHVYDLLSEATLNYPILRESLKVRERNKQTFIRGLVKKSIRGLEEALRLVQKANSRRRTSSNNLNRDSSRSHCICQIQVIKKRKDSLKVNESASAFSCGYNTDEEASEIARQKPVYMWIVDLAGSERSKRTNVSTVRQKEASMINKSLMNLMRCLSIMGEKQNSSSATQVIPFRENKLTHLFMPVFTGKCSSSLSMVVNVNPAEDDFDETHHVLSYASKARLVKIEVDEFANSDKEKNTSNEYGFNGRLIKKQKSAASKIATFVKRLSPKRLTHRSISNKGTKRLPHDDKHHDRKRKATAAPARIASFTTYSTAGVSTRNTLNTDPDSKRMRVIKDATVNSHSKIVSEDLMSNDKESAKSLRLKLCVAQTEIDTLKSENSNLLEQLGQLEEKIRQEVSEESEAQLETTKQHYTEIIDRMKAQSRQSISVFEKKSREEIVSDQIDELIFKVEECEEEMKRQETNHKEEVALLKQKYDKEIEAYKEENRKLKQRTQSFPEDGTASNASIVEEQRVTINELRKELEVAKKSKADLIVAYEQLLNDEQTGESEEDEEFEDSDNDENDDPNRGQISLRKGIQPCSKHHCTQTHSKASKNEHVRAPLTVVSSNRTKLA